MPARPDRGDSTEKRALTNLVRYGRTPDEGAALLQQARTSSPASVFRRALAFQADSALLDWDECLRVAQLFESVTVDSAVAAAS